MIYLLLILQLNIAGNHDLSKYKYKCIHIQYPSVLFFFIICHTRFGFFFMRNSFVFVLLPFIFASVNDCLFVSCSLSLSPSLLLFFVVVSSTFSLTHANKTYISVSVNAGPLSSIISER